MLLQSIARIVVKYAGNAAGFGVAGDAILDIWDAWNKETPDRQRKLAEVQELAEQSAGETRELAQSLAQEVAADQPETVRQAVASYLTQVPAMVRRSLKRPADPTGRTLPPGLLLGKPEDLLEFLPAKPARFKPGDFPLASVDLELVELLGVGGFGEVWKARNPYQQYDPPVALKFCIDTQAALSLRHEAGLLDRVKSQGIHAGIVRLLRTYLRADPPCLEYEYVAGGDLTGLIHDRHRAAGGCSPLAMTELIAQLAEIVGFAHRLSPPIVHRDLKTANILVNQLPGGMLQLKVADFGIGGIAASEALKDAEMRPTNYMTAMATGTCTPLYASPQQQAGRPADPRDDVYSIGVIWYQALTGNLSAGRPGGAAWRRKLVEQGLPVEVVNLLDSCFEDEPDNRPRDAAELAERMKALLPPEGAGGDNVQPLHAAAKFWEAFFSRPTVKTTRYAAFSPLWGGGGIGGDSSVRGLGFGFIVGQKQARVQLGIWRGSGSAAENKQIFDQLYRQKNEIEQAFGAELAWDRGDDKQSCRIYHAITGGGYKTDESKWPRIQDAMIDAMIRLEKAFAPHLANLKNIESATHGEDDVPQPPEPPDLIGEPVAGPSSGVMADVRQVLEEDGRWQFDARPNCILLLPKTWLDWLPKLALRGDPQWWIYGLIGARDGKLSFGVDAAPMKDPAKRTEIVTKLHAECSGFGFQRPRSASKEVKNNWSRITATERILEWGEDDAPTPAELRAAVKKTLDDLYPKLEKLAVVLKPLCKLPTPAT